MERVDGTQARLKQILDIPSMAASIVERVDGTQARLKHTGNEVAYCTTWPRGKGGWDSGEIETDKIDDSDFAGPSWKGWMGLRRD